MPLTVLLRARSSVVRSERTCNKGPHVRLAPLYDIASILPYDEFDFHFGGEYLLRDIALRQWQKFSREVRIDGDKLIDRLRAMATYLPDAISDVQQHARNEGLDPEVIDRLTERLVQRADACKMALVSGDTH